MPTSSYTYTGDDQFFYVPVNVASPITINIGGGRGGAVRTIGSGNTNSIGGKGGIVTGILNVDGGEILRVSVGGRGISVDGVNDTSNKSRRGGAFPDGGNGGLSANASVRQLVNGAAGGGATHIFKSVDGGNTWTRVCVAGAGGGAGYNGGSNDSTSQPLASGGHGGGTVGQKGGSGSGSAGGGTQSGGGSGGQDVGGQVQAPATAGSNGYTGSGGTGEDSKWTGQAGYCGGGGGGGYFCGGGGGQSYLSDTNCYGAGAGGGSSYTGGLDSVTVNTQGTNTANDGVGFANITYTLRPDVTASDTMASTGGMTLSPLATKSSGVVSPSATVTMSISGTRARTGALPLTALTSLSVNSSASRTPASSMSASGTMANTGYVSRFGAANMLATAKLGTDEFQAKIFMTSQSSLVLTPRVTELATMTLRAVAKALTTGHSYVPSSNLVGAVAAALNLGKIVDSSRSSMAARGSVSLVGARTALGGVLIHPLTSMTLSGALVRHTSGLLISSRATLTLGQLISHIQQALMSAQASAQFNAQLTELVAHQMSAYVSLALVNTMLSNVVHMDASGSLTFDFTQTPVLEAPYLTVTGPYSNMTFSVTSTPNLGSVRQKVTPHA